MNRNLNVVMDLKTQEGVPQPTIFCPACKSLHAFDKRWKFNGNYIKPTFIPSMLVHGNEKNLKETNGRYGHRCHSFVEDGKIRFLGDCSHDMKNTTVGLEAI